MSDAALRQAGKLVLLVGVVLAVVGEVGYNLAAPSTGARPGFAVILTGGLVLLVLGVLGWALGRIPSTNAEDQVNPRIRRIGFLLFVVGVVAFIAGMSGWALTQSATYPALGIGTSATVGLWLTVVGAIVVALSHRARRARGQTALTQP